MEPIRKVPGDLNPVDLGTRPSAIPSDLGLGSVWQQGPQFLLQDRKDWPLTDVPVGDWIPPEELKEVKYPGAQLSAYVSQVLSVVPQSTSSKLKEWIHLLCSKTVKLNLVCGVVARCLRAGGRTDWRENLATPLELEPRDLAAARKLVFLAFMDQPRKLLESGDLKTLGAWKENGSVYMRGRFSPASMDRLVGVDKLPVIPGDSRLAFLLAWEAHLEDHKRDVVIVLARLRRRAWVIRGGTQSRRW